MKRAIAMLLLLCLVSMGVMTTASADKSFDVTVWVAESIADLTQEQIKNFNAGNEAGITINATIEAVSEADAASRMITDAEAGADLFCFNQDQVSRLVQAGAVSELSDTDSAFVKGNNASGVVAAATSGEAIIAYPLAADNGYFLVLFLEFRQRRITELDHLVLAYKNSVVIKRAEADPYHIAAPALGGSPLHLSLARI